MSKTELHEKTNNALKDGYRSQPRGGKSCLCLVVPSGAAEWALLSPMPHTGHLDISLRLLVDIGSSR